MKYPANFRYTDQHEWVLLDGSAATVGITDHAQHQLGDIVYLELPKVGDPVESGKACGTVESVKAVSEIYSPVTGAVTEVNGALVEKPEWINQDPHGKAWMIRVSLSAPPTLDKLFTAEQYEEYVRQETAE
jgi:glycine cleavage system H protein